MDIFVFTGTSTYAMRAADLLKRKGYKVRTGRKTGLGYGCGYGIYVNQVDINDVRKILTENGVKILGIGGRKDGIS